MDKLYQLSDLGSRIREEKPQSFMPQGMPLIHGFSPKSLAACSGGRVSIPGNFWKRIPKVRSGQKGDTSSGNRNSARLKDACTVEKSHDERPDVAFFFLFPVKHETIPFLGVSWVLQVFYYYPDYLRRKKKKRNSYNTVIKLARFFGNFILRSFHLWSFSHVCLR